MKYSQLSLFHISTIRVSTFNIDNNPCDSLFYDFFVLILLYCVVQLFSPMQFSTISMHSPLNYCAKMLQNSIQTKNKKKNEKSGKWLFGDGYESTRWYYKVTLILHLMMSRMKFMFDWFDQIIHKLFAVLHFCASLLCWFFNLFLITMITCCDQFRIRGNHSRFHLVIKAKTQVNFIV